jgi:hypothetical protein
MNKPILDFQILQSFDPRVILVADNSIWEHISNKPAIIEIITPGAEEAIVHYFEKNKINSFNSVNLFLNCPGDDCGCDGNGFEYLPDGVYSITIKGSPDTYTICKKHLQTAKTRLRLDKQYASLHLNCERIDKSKEVTINEIEFLLLAAEANVRLDFINDAYDLLMAAQSILDKLECKNCY